MVLKSGVEFTDILGLDMTNIVNLLGYLHNKKNRLLNKNKELESYFGRFKIQKPYPWWLKIYA